MQDRLKGYSMNDYSHVFSPFRVGNTEIKNRIETPPMLSCLATMDGFVTREMIDFYQAFARGGAGIVTVGDTAIDFDYGRGHFGQLNLGDDRVIGGLSDLVEAIQKYGARISIELNHPGRLSPPIVLNGRNPIGPSPIATNAELTAADVEGRPALRATEMNQRMIDQVVENYVAACARCLKAGFEMVMIHGGHGHLLGQFVSPYSNKRTDHYGGCLENRARFVVEVLTAIRRRVGNRLAIEYRISADEMIPEGMHEEETIEFLKILGDKIDLVNASLGMLAEPQYIPYMSQPTYFPHAFNVKRAARIKKETGIPVTCVGSIMDLETADRIIASGEADIVAMGRAHVADPEIVNRTRLKGAERVRPCVRCSTCGEKAKDFLPVRCAVNPVIGREAEYTYLRPASEKKKILIAGGGPAGMEAAITASSRGHRVILCEKDERLGGALRVAAVPSFKSDMKRFLQWLIKETERSPAEIRRSTTVTAQMIIQEQPDALIIAVGGEPISPDIAGSDNPLTMTVEDAYRGATADVREVVVAGAGMTGCECALYLAQEDKRVTLIDMVSEQDFAGDGSFVNRMALTALLKERGVRFVPEVVLKEITNSGVAVVDKHSRVVAIPAGRVVLSLGFRPRSDVVDPLRRIVPETYVVGDCSQPRNVMAAVHSAFTVAAEI
jgi:2,4-dienoyl-CoA reductase-like NADH-dependent reductase (Old Yellow Enzyme family)/thioredoxin reductase